MVVKLISTRCNVCSEHSYFLSIQTCRFSVSSLYCVVKRGLKIVPIWCLYSVVVVTGEIIRWNTKNECVDGFEMLLVAMGSDDQCKCDGEQ